MLQFIKKSMKFTKKKFAAALLFFVFYFGTGFMGALMATFAVRLTEGAPPVPNPFIAILFSVLRILIFYLAAHFVLLMFKNQESSFVKRDAAVLLTLIAWLAFDKIAEVPRILTVVFPFLTTYGQNTPSFLLVFGFMFLVTYFVITLSLEFIFPSKQSKG